jgi:hypothetical protein
MADEFTYFIKFLDENSDQYYLKSSIDERKTTISMHLTNLKHSWSGTRRIHFSFYLVIFIEKPFYSQSRTSSQFSQEISIGNQ